MMFKDRFEAGKKLIIEVKRVVKGESLVLGIPRGGVVIGKVVADKLGWKFDVLVTKKIGFPRQEELAMGAVAEDGRPVWDKRLKKRVSEDEWKKELIKTREKVERYIREFRKEKKLNVKGKTVIIVDDGIATGKTVEAGISWLRKEEVNKIVIATPVCAKDTAEKLKELVDEWICLSMPVNFMAVGQFYEEFSQVSDEEVKQLLVE